MSHWNYRFCMEQVSDGVGGTELLYSVREVYYDDDGKVIGIGQDPTTFVGDTPGEVYESLNRALKTYPGSGVLDLETRETVKVTYHGKRK